MRYDPSAISCLAVSVLLLLLDPLLGAYAQQVNITMDDMSAAITYSPALWWFASSNASGCSYCLAPANSEVAFGGTWHHGVHVLPNVDNDDIPTSSTRSISASTPPSHASTPAATSTTPSHTSAPASPSPGAGGPAGQQAAASPAPTKAPVSTGDHDKDDDDKDGNDKDSDASKAKGKSRRRRAVRRNGGYYAARSTTVAAALETGSPFVVQKFDSDDPQFVDDPVFAQFVFNGSAIYVNCLLPMGVPINANMTPTFTNLTFTLDGQLADDFLHDGHPQSTGFQPNATVFSRENLSADQHTLRIDLGPNSVFLLDSIIVTQDNSSDATNTTSSVPSTGPSSSSSKASGNNVATFAGAIGGSVGTITVVALCVAGNLMRRRRRAAKRDRRERQLPYHSSDVASFHTFDDATSVRSGPSMRGIAPPLTFRPRYFPGSATLPTYRLAPGVDTSYADVLPDDSSDETEELPLSVPGPIDEANEVPPPFAVAIASSEPPLLATALHRDRSPTSIPNSEMSEAGFFLPLTLQIASPPPQSRPPSFHSVSSLPSGLPTSVSDASTIEPAPTTDSDLTRTSTDTESTLPRDSASDAPDAESVGVAEAVGVQEGGRRSGEFRDVAVGQRHDDDSVDATSVSLPGTGGEGSSIEEAGR